MTDTVSPDGSPGDLSAELAPYRLHWGRYRRTLLFAAWLFARVLGWELVLRHVLGERVVSRGRSQRLRGWAREFRSMATAMGGVMIKLGQFISSRADVLPPEVIDELAGLQDEVPIVPFAQIRPTVDAELGAVETRFASFDTNPVAAASLGQAHRARLPGGEQVVVKVQRPGIRSLVHTDLQALDVVAGWAMRLGFIRRRADVPALLEEFSAALWEELDYTHEAQNVALFQRLFASDKGVYIPGVYPDYSTRRVLTLEDVTAIKVTDIAAFEEAGVDRRDVARRLIATYLWMVFRQRVFHADPHPGNLFVYPLDPDSPTGSGQHGNGTPLRGRPFYLIFVDFGMVGRLTPAIETGLREALIALTTRDAERLVAAYETLGVLLPGADRGRIEQATRRVFDRLWGMSLSEISEMQFTEMRDLGREFQDLIFSLPFQVPQDFIVLTRAIGILTGLVTSIDPDFDPWREIGPFAQELAGESDAVPDGLPPKVTPRDLLNPKTLRALLSEDVLEQLMDSGFEIARRSAQLPLVADSVLRRADRGDLVVRVTPAPDLTRDLGRVEDAVLRLVAGVLAAGFSLSAAILYAAGEQVLAGAGGVLALLALLRALWGGRRP